MPIESKVGSKGAPRSAAAARAEADGTSELDLTGYAKTLGVSIRNGVVHKEGSTLSKILMDSLAKEYLRVVSALRCYQNAFGPLQEESADQDEVATQSAASLPHSPTRMRPADPLSTTHTSLNLGMDLAALAVEQPAPTPRSPAGPPSPDPRRCRQQSNEAVQSARPEGSPQPPVALETSPGTTTAAASQVDRARSSSSVIQLGQEPTAASYLNPNAEQETVEAPPSPPAWTLDDLKSTPFAFSEIPPLSESHQSETKPVSTGFGLFGSRM